MKQKIEQAFKDFDAGVRPDGYREPKHWYVLNEKNKFYPAKGIWALATNAEKTSSFNSIDAREAFTKYGYALFDTRQLSVEPPFEELVKKSKDDSSEQRAKRLKQANKKPSVEYSIVKSYRRNADVVAEVLLRAKGICERCGKSAPFLRRNNGTPYLEVHHKKQLAKGGEDTVENAIAVCPNCHREMHYG